MPTSGAIVVVGVPAGSSGDFFFHPVSEVRPKPDSWLRVACFLFSGGRAVCSTYTSDWEQLILAMWSRGFGTEGTGTDQKTFWGDRKNKSLF